MSLLLVVERIYGVAMAYEESMAAAAMVALYTMYVGSSYERGRN
jgi:hypothetical protein